MPDWRTSASASGLASLEQMDEKTFTEVWDDLKAVHEAKLEAYGRGDMEAALEYLLEERELHEELVRRAPPPATEPLR